ncbi:MAG: recombinase family protein [Dehalococcoidia bacterium]|nr:recombinase family protein [Dehalococcoidia bacterium]
MTDDGSKMPAAVYARVSSERQDVDLSISAQLKAIREYAERGGYQVVREYVDEAESGRSIDRPGFKAMIAAARQSVPPFRFILVWKLSRFARNREDSIIYKSLLRKHGVQVVSINEPLEDTPSGRLLEGIIEVIDEFYSANLSQDVVRGMRENASRGFYPGSPVPFGYRRIKVQDGDAQRSKLEPDPDAAPVVERIFQECLSGKGLLEITQGLNGDGLATRMGGPWAKTSIHKVLHNEAYTGVLVWAGAGKGRAAMGFCRYGWRGPGRPWWTWRPSSGPRRSWAPRDSHPRVTHSEYILSGMLRCRRCSTSMIGHAVKSGRFFYYMCGNARKRGREVCTTPLMPKDRIEGFIVDRIKQHILTEENLEEVVRIANHDLAQLCSTERERLSVLEGQVADVDNRLAKLYDALETGEFKGGELASRVKVLFQKKEELLRARAEAQEALRNYTVQLADPEVVRGYINELRAFLENSGMVERKAFLKSFVKRIEVDDSEATVVYTIPLLPDNPPTASEVVGVLPFVHDGPPYRTEARTFELALDLSA